MQRAMVVAEGEDIREEDLPESVRGRKAESAPAPETELSDDGSKTLEDASKRLLLAALVTHEGNASAVMRELNIGRTRFYRMLRKFGLEERIETIRQSGKV
jgi:transcriptional regulator of acetoin/glycerol metabolism